MIYQKILLENVEPSDLRHVTFSSISTSLACFLWLHIQLYSSLFPIVQLNTTNKQAVLTVSPVEKCVVKLQASVAYV